MTDYTEDHHQTAITELKSGIAGYARFQDKLSAQISVDEAVTAETVFKRGLLITRAVLIGWAVLIALEYAFEGYASLPWHKFYYELINALLLLAALILRSWFQMPFAGRILIPTMYFSQFLEAPPDWHPYALENIKEVLILFGSGFLGPFVHGWLLDYGAATEPYRSRPKLRRIVLSLVGLLELAFWVGSFILLGLSTSYFLFSSIGAAMTSVWGWWPSRWIEQKLSVHSGDVSLVLQGAWWRWGRRAGGRFLTVLFFSFPFFLFLNVLGIQGKLDWPLNESGQALHGKPVVSYDEPDNSPLLWYWKRKGRWLEESDFTDPQSSILIYGISNADFPTIEDFGLNLINLFIEHNIRDKELAEIVTFLTVREKDQLSRFKKVEGLDFLSFRDNDVYLAIKDNVTFEQLKQLLEPYRIQNTQQYNRLWNKNGNTKTWHMTIVLETHPVRETIFTDFLANKSNQRMYLQVGLDVEEHTRDQVNLIVSRYRDFAYLSLGVGLLGFAFVWRRGGDSPTGLWFGLLLLFWSGARLHGMAGYSLPAFNYAIWEEALVNPSGGLLVGLVGLFSAGQIMYESDMLIGLIKSIPISLVWIYLCWPINNTRNLNRWKTIPVYFLRFFIFWIIIILACGLIYGLYSLCAYFIEVPDFQKLFDDKSIDDEFDVLLSTYLSDMLLGIIVLIGYLFRKRTRVHSEINYLGVLPVFTFLTLLLCQQTAWCLVPRTLNKDSAPIEFLVSPQGQQCYEWAYWLSVSALALLAFSLIRRNFLRVFTAKGLAFVILTVLVPVFFEVGENIASDLLQKTTFFSDDGAQLLGLLATVLVLAPLWDGINRLLQTLLSPRLHKIEKEMDEMLELLLEQNNPDERNAAVSRLFEKLDVDHYAFYERTKGGDFKLLTGKGLSPANSLHLSKYLRDFLCKHRMFIDLAEAPFEWDTFFHQFELHRLQNTTGYRYLLPLCLGNSIQGLLMLSDEQGAAVINKESFFGNLEILGLAALYNTKK